LADPHDGLPQPSGYIFFDIENNGTAPDGNGWNTVWNGPCGGRVKAS
jgi:hypothetical protein